MYRCIKNRIDEYNIKYRIWEDDYGERIKEPFVETIRKDK